ncbi:MAG: alpha/beta hydrolase, partial [Candidatus Nanopelagicales bacterium]
LIPGELMVRAPVLDMRQAGHYRHDLGLRAAVLDHVSETIRQIDDDILLFAHSLGSVVALDALHLREMRVAMLITFGSPLGVRHFWGQPWEGSDGFPFARVGGWLNVVNTRDPVPWQRGVSNRFPTAVDSFISAGLGYSGTDGFHDATTYVASAPVVATLIDQVRRNAPPDSGT